MEYILCRQHNQRGISDSKVVVGGRVARLRMVASRMTGGEVKEVDKGRAGSGVVEDDWSTGANVIRRILGVSSGRKADKETWW